MTQRDPDLRAFPSEAEWLRLPPPDISTDFVARTLLRLDTERRTVTQHEPTQHEAAELPDAEPDNEDPAGWAALLQQYEAPAASADFVARTVNRIQQQQRSRWQSLLSRYVVPPVTPEFVERTLVALSTRTPQRGVHPMRARHRRALPWLLAAALLTATLWLAGMFTPQRSTAMPEATRPGMVQLGGDSPLPTVFAQMAIERDPDELPYASTAGFALLVVDNAAAQRGR